METQQSKFERSIQRLENNRVKLLENPDKIKASLQRLRKHCFNADNSDFHYSN